MTEISQNQVKPEARDRWAWILALAFVVVTLTGLVTIPVLVQRRVDRLRDRITASEPARTLMMGLQFNLVREMSTLNQFILTNDPQTARRFAEARVAERRMWRELTPLARKLGTNVQEQFVEARTIAELWHERLGEETLLRAGPGRLEKLQAADVRERLEDVLRATSRLDSTVLSVTQSQRTRIEAAERAGLLLTLISGGLALLAAAVVAALVLRLRRLAIEAESRRRQTVDALAESARAAEMRQRLLRGITHDVKNPLGAARGYAELLGMELKGELNHQQVKLVEGVDRSISSALAIISDLLDLARADSGGITIHRDHVDLNNLISQSIEDQRAAASAAGHEIVCQDIAGTLMAYTDASRVRRIIDNLISNAIKYTPPPGRIMVRIEANATDAPFDRRAVAIRVTDTGPGIPEHQREQVFDEFARLDHDGDMKGHGLGLSVARRLARLLGGELGIVDTQGHGSTFVLWLPNRELRSRQRQLLPDY